ncbi:MAG: hypothetical protein ACK51V_02450, partial [bacterium]
TIILGRSKGVRNDRIAEDNCGLSPIIPINLFWEVRTAQSVRHYLLIANSSLERLVGGSLCIADSFVSTRHLGVREQPEVTKGICQAKSTARENIPELRRSRVPSSSFA